MTSRRDLLLSALLGAGGVGLRAFATGLPPSFLANPVKALADLFPPRGTPNEPQYVIFNTSADGDPLNASVPGTYEDPTITHSLAPEMAPRTLRIRGIPRTAAAPWSTLPQKVLDRTVFWHLMTGTPVHSKEPEVLKLSGATRDREMFPSLVAKQLAPRLHTIQSEPISVGARTPSEGLSFGGAALPVLPPLALKATLATPNGPLGALSSLRVATLNRMFGVYKTTATAAQRTYLDAMVTSQEQLRNIRDDLVDSLASIVDNGPESQVVAAVALVQMRVSPVVAIHIPFGGDNHRDVGLAAEAAQTVSGVGTLASLMQRLTGMGLEDKVTFVTLNVFGRTLGPGTMNGRHHNANHQTSITIGKPFKGGVVGAVRPLSTDFGAMPIDPVTGNGQMDGAIRATDTIAALGRTILAALGSDPALVDAQGGTAKVVTAALA